MIQFRQISKQYNDGAKTVSTVGNGASVGFMLVFVLAVTIAAAMVILTMMKKKENY